MIAFRMLSCKPRSVNATGAESVGSKDKGTDDMVDTGVHVVTGTPKSTNPRTMAQNQRHGRASATIAPEGAPMLLDPRQGVLFIVDVQARLAPAMTDPDAAIARMRILLAAADQLAGPIVASEQYPQGLGHTDERLTLPPATAVFAKTAFSASRDPAILAHLERLDRRQVVLCGMETHVCVLQTALD